MFFFSEQSGLSAYEIETHYPPISSEESEELTSHMQRPYQYHFPNTEHIGSQHSVIVQFEDTENLPQTSNIHQIQTPDNFSTFLM